MALCLLLDSPSWTILNNTPDYKRLRPRYRKILEVQIWSIAFVPTIKHPRILSLSKSRIWLWLLRAAQIRNWLTKAPSVLAFESRMAEEANQFKVMFRYQNVMSGKSWRFVCVQSGRQKVPRPHRDPTGRDDLQLRIRPCTVGEKEYTRDKGSTIGGYSYTVFPDAFPTGKCRTARLYQGQYVVRIQAAI